MSLICNKINATITKKSVSSVIANVSNDAQDLINKLYSNNGHGFLIASVSDIRDAIEKNKEKIQQNRYDFLNNAKDKTGVYLFMDSNNIPMYIGKGGAGKKDDLKRRIKNECKINPSEDTGARPSLNIRSYYSLLGVEKTDDEIIKILLSWRVIGIPIGDMIPENQAFSAYIESLLILIYQPVFNKQG